MRKLLVPVAALVAVTIAAACYDQSTDPRPSARTATALEQRGGTNARPNAVSAPVAVELLDPVTGAVAGTLTGTAHLTKIIVDGNGSLQGEVTIVGTAVTAAVTKAVTIVDTTSLSIAGRSSVNGAATQAATTQAATAFGSCPIVNLDLGPLDLNVLGLEVHLNEVVLDVVAQSGAGNLLGNLLCTVVHLLDAGAVLTAILDIINSINAILAALPI